MRKKLSQAFLRKVLDYTPSTGRLVWRPRPREMFATPRAFTIWNKRFAGKTAFTARGPRYFHGTIGGVMYEAHSVIFCWMTGRWAREVGHEDGDGFNNRWRNLGEVTHRQNQMNMRRARTYAGKPVKCPAAGVEFRYGKYRAYLGVKGVRIRTIQHSTLEAAVAAREALKRQHGFSWRHGKEAVSGRAKHRPLPASVLR